MGIEKLAPVIALLIALNQGLKAQETGTGTQNNGKMSLTELVEKNIQKQDSAKNELNKRALDILVEGESKSTNPVGVMVNNYPGYLTALSEQISPKTKVSFAEYYSKVPGFVPQSLLAIQHDFNETVGAKGRLFVPVGDQNPHAVLEGYINLAEARLEAGHWNLLNGDYQNWLGVLVKAKINNSKYAPEFQARLLQIFDNKKNTSTFGQFGIGINLREDIKARINLQVGDDGLGKVDSNLGFSVSKEFRVRERKRR